MFQPVHVWQENQYICKARNCSWIRPQAIRDNWKSPFVSAPPRLQRILLQMQKHDYIRVHSSTSLERSWWYQACCQGPHFLLMTTAWRKKKTHIHVQSPLSLPTSESKLDELREAMVNDTMLRDLKEEIKSGWPETKSWVPVNTRKY